MVAVAVVVVIVAVIAVVVEAVVVASATNETINFRRKRTSRKNLNDVVLG